MNPMPHDGSVVDRGTDAVRSHRGGDDETRETRAVPEVYSVCDDRKAPTECRDEMNMPAPRASVKQA